MKESIHIAVQIRNGSIILTDAIKNTIRITYRESEAMRSLMAQAEVELKWPLSLPLTTEKPDNEGSTE